MKTILIFITILIMALPGLEASISTGTIKGKVVEDSSGRAIAGVRVWIMDTVFQDLSDENGKYELHQIPVGNYRIRFSCDSFTIVIKTDVLVRPDRITFLNVKMQEELPRLNETVEVKESYFYKNPEVPTGNVKISAEEIRRTPGTAGFTGRVITTLPGVGFSGADENTDLLVRGGSPDENGFFIDDIEVPNINHLPRLGSTGGVFSAFNPDLVQHIDFFSGAFSADYGNRLSSITNISFREGNRNEFDGEFDANLFMTGLVCEGPLNHGKGSWLVAGRTSYVKLLNELDILDVGETLNTRDLQIKLVYEFSPKHKLYLINLLADGNFRDFYGGPDGAEVTEDNVYTQNTTGFSWKAIWNNNFFSTTSLSYSWLKRTDSEAYPIYERDYHWESEDTARYFSLRNSNFVFFGNKDRLEFGVQIKHERNHIDYYQHQYYDRDGDFIPVFDTNFDYQTTKSAIYVSFLWNPLKRFTLTTGIRGDYSSAHDAYHLSPRLSASLHLSNRISLNGGFGIFYQTIPIRFLTLYSEHLSLADIKAIHYTLGIEYINSGTRLTLEVFEKKYDNLLIDPKNPQYLASELAIDTYYYPERLTNNGSGYSRGIELLIQKKLVKHFYGLFSMTIFKSRYRDFTGIWRKSGFETPFILNLLAGYKPNIFWEFGIRWMVMTGRPTTPIDENLSKINGMLVYDLSRFNEHRYPTYNKLNLRVERRFFFKKSNLALYLDMWNVFNNETIYEYEWNGANGGVEANKHLPIMPILGLKYEF
jgi:outer membrane receptor for ferrienterochelin and colicin